MVRGTRRVADGVLRVLERFGAPSTVFAVGTWLDAFPHMGRRILDGGHDLGNHTYQHLPMGTLDAATAYSQIARGSAAIMRCTGQAARWFRPSGIVHATPRILAAANLAGFEHCIGYDVDPADYTDPGARLVTARTLRSARAGAIVSLHLGHAGTLTALPAVLRGARRHPPEGRAAHRAVVGDPRVTDPTGRRLAVTAPALVLTVGVLLSGCVATASELPVQSPAADGRPVATSSAPAPASPTAASATVPLPGMPPLLDPHDVYAADRPDALSPVVAGDPIGSTSRTPWRTRCPSSTRARTGSSGPTASGTSRSTSCRPGT